MGLREVKAERTRRSILKAAFDLFEREGYDGATMEEVAAAAEVGTSTLYRYFPSKVDLLLTPVAQWNDHLAAGLATRPAGEPILESLRQVVLDYLRQVEVEADFVAQLRRLVEAAPIARAGLWDVYSQEQAALVRAVADRMGMKPTEPRAVLAAYLAMSVVQICLEASWTDPEAVPTAVAEQYFAAIRNGELSLLA
ncbi:MAG: TetR/AcrR family transcriptional regulator [Propionibacteriaceae bacterium]|jgi:AcrR family transcriptional regulator|nr:TetR/AcrR family transcriptional regulator [Propionibacteriaceae bacterium]